MNRAHADSAVERLLATVLPAAAADEPFWLVKWQTREGWQVRGFSRRPDAVEFAETAFVQTDVDRVAVYPLGDGPDD